MYLIVAFAVTVMVIALAWRGVGATQQPHDDADETAARRPARPTRHQPTRVVAPDDDPEFLSEIDRRLRGEGTNGKNN